MNKSTSGFTIVEIAVVVVIISILATLVTVGFNRTQADTRDTLRSSRTTVIANALEKYYDENGDYPSCSSLTQSGSVVANSVLAGIDPATLLTPKSAAAATNSISCADLTTTTGPDTYAYIGDGTASCSTGAACTRWTLKYIDEGSNQIKTISSQHK